MDYPEDFDTSAFPAGRRIALSRAVAICTAVSFLVILFCCVAIPWLHKNRSVNPYVIYINAPVGEWELIGRTAVKRNVPYYYNMQYSLVGVFVEKWFAISQDAHQNEKRWERCNRKDICNNQTTSTIEAGQGCDIYCLTDDNLYQVFTEDILPLYQVAEAAGEYWYFDTNSMIITPDGEIRANGGRWIVRGRVSVRSETRNGDFDVIAYIKVMNNQTKYPQTLGFYVADINAYREQ